MKIKNQYIDLILIIAFTALSMIILNIDLLNQNEWLKVALSIPIIFFFTGYGIISVLFPQRKDLNLVIRLILSLVISVAIIPFYGFFITYDPFKIFTNYFIIFPGFLTIILLIATYIRRYRKIEYIKKGGSKETEHLHVYRLKHGFKDLFITGFLTIVSLLIIYTPFELIELIPFLLLTFILPGYSLTALLFWDMRDLSFIKKLILSLGLSIVLVLIMGVFSEFIYNIPSKTTFLIIALLTIVFLILAGLRRRKKLKEDSKFIREVEKPREHEKIFVRKVRKDSKRGKIPGKDIKISKSNKDLNILVLFLLLAVVFITISPLSQTVFRSIFVIPLILLLPGYALLTIIFPKTMVSSKNRLKIVQVLLAGILLSLLITLGIGVLVFIAPCPISSQLCIGLLIIVTATLIGIAYLRRRRLSRMKIIKSEISQKRGKEEVIDETVKLRHLAQKESVTPDSVQPEAWPKGKKESKPKLYSGRFKFLANDLIIILLFTFLTTIFVTVPVLNGTVIKTVLELIFILFIPGYSLIAALFPRKQDLDGIERVALSFGLSIAITPLIGLILNYTSFEIRLDPILIVLSLLSFILIVVAFLRRRRIPDQEKFKLNLGVHFHNLKSSFDQEKKLDKILSIILIISIILAISATIYIIVTPKEGEKFTEFYILGAGGKASDYPTNLTIGQSGTIIVGIVNHEYSNVTYNLLVKFNGTTVTSKNITLTNGQKWEEPLTFNASTLGKNQKLELLLYKLPDQDKAYRSLHLWVDVV